MKTNYQDLTNEELNKLAAEMVGWIERLAKDTDYGTGDQYGRHFCWAEPYDGKYKYSFRFFTQCLDHETMLENEYWNPTHPDSNQAERYLFPALAKVNAISCRSMLGDFCVTIALIGGDMVGQCCSITENEDQINRTKVIACLEAMEKLNGL